MSELNRINDGGDVGAITDYNDYLNRAKQTPRSVYNLSRVKTTTIDMGALIPIDFLKCLPGDSVDLSNDVLVMGLSPMVKRMLDTCSIYIHYYYSRCNDLWKGWNNYITKGRSGKIALTKPCVAFGGNATAISTTQLEGGVRYLGKDCMVDKDATSSNAQNYEYNYLTPMSLAVHLGVPMKWFNRGTKENLVDYVDGMGEIPKTYSLLLPYITLGMQTDYLNANHGVGRRFGRDIDVDALPFAMYQRIYRDYYLNKNLCQGNPNWFPADEDDFILPYTSNIGGGKYHAVLHNEDGTFTPTGATSGTFAYMVDNWKVNNNEIQVRINNATYTKYDNPALPILRWRQWKLNEKTAGLPWQQRGDQLNLFGTTDVATVDKIGTPTGSGWNETGVRPIVKGASNTQTDLNTGAIGYATSPTATGSLSLLGQNAAIGVSLTQLNITANAMRELFVLSQWQENMARTDGDYNSLIKAQFGQSPKWRDRTPIYIGGTKQQLIFNEVLQTSEDASTPLGTQAGRAVSAATGSVGHFEVPDYGYIMAIMSIIPDNTYSTQGLPKELRGGTSFADEYFPIFNNLAPEPIEEDEISVAGTNNNASNVNSLFAWRERYAYLKTRENQVSGLLTLSPLESDYAAYTFARYFFEKATVDESGDKFFTNTRVTFNNDFVTASFPHLRRDMFSTPSEPMFLVQMASRVRAVRPIPVAVKPASLDGIAM